MSGTDNTATLISDAKKRPAAKTIKHGPRAQKAMVQIMDAAERLFALNGIEGVALRQILIEAKQRNKFAISLYFGSKEELVVALIGRRTGEMNVHRRKLMEAAIARGTLDDARTLLEIIYRPMAEVSDATGQYTYPRFLQQVMLYHSLSSRWPTTNYEGPHSEANKRMHGLVSNLSEDLFDGLLAVISGIFLTAVTTRGLRIIEGRATVPFEEFFQAVLDMATAAFDAARNPRA